MIVVSSRDLRNNFKKYFELAITQRVVVKRRNFFLELVPRGLDIPDSPSPSKDPYFDDPRNIERILASAKSAKEGNLYELTPELQKELFGS